MAGLLGLDWLDALLGQQSLPHTCVPCTLLCGVGHVPRKGLCVLHQGIWLENMPCMLVVC